jgi:hypothetical protein
LLQYRENLSIQLPEPAKINADLTTKRNFKQWRRFGSLNGLSAEHGAALGLPPGQGLKSGFTGTLQIAMKTFTLAQWQGFNAFAHCR